MSRMSDESIETGSPKQSSRSQILSILSESEDPVLSTKEIADRLPITDRGTRHNLRRLAEEGTIGSKKYTTQGDFLVWWPGKIGEGTETDQPNSQTGDIGVEVVDNIDLGRDGEALQSRRYAVNAVFRHLFHEEEATTTELKKIAFVGDPYAHYASPDSIWNNYVVAKALPHYPAFFKSTDDGWALTDLAVWIKREFGEDVLWQDWTANKERIYGIFFTQFWANYEHVLNLAGIDLEFHSQERADLRVGLFDDFEFPLLLKLSVAELFTQDPTGTLELQLQVLDDDEASARITGNIDAVKSDLLQIGTVGDSDFEIIRPEDDDSLILSVTGDVQIDIHSLDPDQKSSDRFPPVKDTQWLVNAVEQFLRILDRNLT